MTIKKNVMKLHFTQVVSQYLGCLVGCFIQEEKLMTMSVISLMKFCLFKKNIYKVLSA